MQEVSEKYNNDSYRERHALSVERLRTLPFEESVEDSYIAYFRLVRADRVICGIGYVIK